jgi:hypothetical protein
MLHENIQLTQSFKSSDEVETATQDLILLLQKAAIQATPPEDKKKTLQTSFWKSTSYWPRNAEHGPNGTEVMPPQTKRPTIDSAAISNRN